MKEVILVNEFDQPIGVLEKLEAHQKGLLHRAFSIFIFNDSNELMLQRRAFDKYHLQGFGQIPAVVILIQTKVF